MSESPIRPTEMRGHRTGLLQFASKLTRCVSDQKSVVANAAVLEAWYEAGATPGDKRDRFAALSRTDINRSYKRAPDDRPELLIAEAEIFYAFLKAA